MFIPKSPYTQVAFETLLNYFAKESSNIQHPAMEIPDELFQICRACFVSIHLQKDDSLRGCIGTLEPQEKNLVKEIQRNVISAAFHDHRFSPLKENEISTIELSVDVLSFPEEIYSLDDLDPLVYGLILSDQAGRRGVLLPALPGIDTVEKQIDIIKRKAGFTHIALNELKFERFTSTRYN